MKYFIDTEFIEGFHKPLFGKKRHFIDLISIAIVSEDGRSYSAISNEYDYREASMWVKDNVIMPLYRKTTPGDQRNFSAPHNFHKRYGKTNSHIAKEIFGFICPYNKASEYAGVGSIDGGAEAYLKQNPPEFYAYYADYDWVVFCSLFGTMMDLPKGFPMYCRDLKQIMDENVLDFMENGDTINGTPAPPEKLSFEECLNIYKHLPGYPKQYEEHSAILDAIWNRDLYKFMRPEIVRSGRLTERRNEA